MKSRTSTQHTNLLILAVCSMAILAMVDATSIFSYLYTLFFFSLFNKYLCKSAANNIWYLHFYLLVAISLFIIHRFLMPDYLGMTGPEGGIGTDDCRYYAQLKDGQVKYPILFNLNETFPFTFFLKTIYPFEINTPLNIIIPNLLGIVYLPYYVRMLAYSLLRDSKVATYAEKLILFCPFTTYYGCIIMRDMWIATLVIATLYYFSKKNYLLLIVFSALVCYIRFGSVVFIGTGVIVILREKIYTSIRSRNIGRFVFLISIIISVVVFILLFPYLQEISGGKLENGVFRESFYAILQATDSDSLILRLIELPIPFNFIALTCFFFFLPFLSLSLYTFNTFNACSLFCTLFTPIFFFFIWRFIIQAILQNIIPKNKFQVRTLIYIALIYALCLGTVSLQARHKTVLMPILCILAAYGICHEKDGKTWLSKILATIVIVIQLYMAI